MMCLLRIGDILIKYLFIYLFIYGIASLPQTKSSYSHTGLHQLGVQIFCLAWSLVGSATKATQKEGRKGEEENGGGGDGRSDIRGGLAQPESHHPVSWCFTWGISISIAIGLFPRHGGLDRNLKLITIPPISPLTKAFILTFSLSNLWLRLFHESITVAEMELQQKKSSRT